IEGLSVSAPGATCAAAVVTSQQAVRVEFVHGAPGTLYACAAMASVVPAWTRTGTTLAPELRLRADGGNFNTADGYLSLAGARGRYDYDVFGDQLNTTGQGINDDYSNSSQGANLGLQINPSTLFRVRARHSNNRTGVSGEWKFNGQALEPPDSDQWARQNNLLASAELLLTGPSRWQHRLNGFEHQHKRVNVDTF